MHVRIGTRRSDLARWQAKYVAGLISAVAPSTTIGMQLIGSLGDRDRKSGFQAIGGIGVFTKESQDALLNNQCDIIVHSLKDLPTILQPGLILASVPKREDPRDCLCGLALADLAPGIRIGTGSIRRQAQLLAICPSLQIKPIRGNVPPRLRKALSKEGIDGTLLAVAGLSRLGLLSKASEILEPDIFPYAAGQGALGIEAREADEELIGILRQIEDSASRAQVDAERALLRSLEAGCSLPIGVFSSQATTTHMRLHATVTSPDGAQQIKYEAVGPASEAEALGATIGENLRKMGAEQILSNCKSSAHSPIALDVEVA